MNLHAIAGPIVAAVNPWTAASYRASIANATEPSGRRTPRYAAAYGVMVQMQPMSADELHQVSGLVQQGTKRGMYVTGDWRGAVRPQFKGGDLITTVGGDNWLVVLELENWSATSGWCKVAVVLQSP